MNGNSITLSGTPDASFIANNQTIVINLTDMNGTVVNKTFIIKVYYKVYNVTVSNLSTTPSFNYYVLSDYNNQQIDLGDLITYSNASDALYRFNQEHVSNVNHPIRFSNKNGSQNTINSNITVTGVPGESNSYVEFLSTNTENYIYCLYHGFGMGVFYQPNLVTTIENGGQISSFTVSNINNKFVLNGDAFLQPKFNFKGAYLFNVETSNMQSRQLVFENKYGNTYSTFYSYKTSGRNDAHVG